jgi:hypothetical protein
LTPKREAAPDAAKHLRATKGGFINKVKGSFEAAKKMKPLVRFITKGKV